MKTIVTFKLMRKCLILVVMILSLVFIASSDRFMQPVEAAPCCESCPGLGDPVQADMDCFNDCAFDPNPQHCYNSCVNEGINCYSRCVYCFSGSGPYGNCTSSSDCPIGYFCDASNTCSP